MNRLKRDLHLVLIFLGGLGLYSCNTQGSKQSATLSSSSSSITKTALWDFTSASNHTFDSTKIRFESGKAKQIQFEPGQVGETSFDQGTGTGAGIVNNRLSLTSAGGCQGSKTNCFELSEDWTPQWSNLVSYWKFENDILDSKSTNHGTAEPLIGHTSSAKIGSRAYSSTDGRAVNFGNAAELHPNTFSISVWVLRKSSPRQFWSILTNEDYFLPGGFYFGDLTTGVSDAHTICLRIGGGVGGPTQSCETEATLDKWVHYVAVYDGDQAYIYKNGVLNDQSDTIDNYDPGNLRLIMTSMEGFIDDMAFWNTTLTAAEVNLIYQNQSAKFAGQYISPIFNLGATGSWSDIDWVTSIPFGKELPGENGNELAADYPDLKTSTGTAGDSSLATGLLGLWHLNETSYAATPGEVIDSSGNLNHGQWSSGTTTLTEGKFNSAPSFVGSDHERINLPTAAPLNFTLADDFTYSVWVKIAKTQLELGQVYNRIVHHTSAVPANFSTLSYSNTAGNVGTVYFSKNDGAFSPLVRTTKVVNDNIWHHYTVTRTGTTLNLYLDGKLEDTTTDTTASANALDSLFLLGGSSGDLSDLTGSIDEFAVWNRGLVEAEVIELYRRGANQVKFQVRSCDDVACSGETWQGPDGTAATYFSEIQNCTTIDAITNSCLDSSLIAKPNLSFTDFTSPPSDNQYFQYKVRLESEDTNNLCLGSPCLPSLLSTNISRSGALIGTAPDIINSSPLTYTVLSSFSDIYSGTCTPTYQLSNANSDFYYWNGTIWALAATSTQSNSAAIINSKLDQFNSQIGSGNLYWKAFLNPDLTQTCELDEVKIRYK